MTMMNRTRTALLLAAACLAAGPATNVDRVPAAAPTPLYPSNRAPLKVTPLAKLPIGSIKPAGWLLRQLQLEADGMGGRLPEVSPWCKFEGNAWTDKDRKGRNGWEEVPYWLKGFGDLGYVLGDQRIIDENQKWIEAILAAQADDGWFGPDGLRTAADGKPDLWPHMPILNAMQSNYEYTAAQGKPDERIIKLMQRYFRWEMNQPEDGFLTGYWCQTRTGDNLESVFWLYNRTGEKWLLDLAKKIDRHTPKWKDHIWMWHNVNLAQGFRYPTEMWQLTGEGTDRKGATKVYDEVMDKYGQVPGGGFGADENARPGYTDPRQAFETCGMVEYMHSFEMLTKITGNPAWADRCEDVALNDFPAAMTPDLKALHYLTSPNSIQLDERSKSPDLANGGEMISFSPGGAYRCCQHNHTMGWPYYAENLWLATADQGLALSLYAPSTVTAKVKGGGEVTVDETTNYPFDGTVSLKVSAKAAATFPMYLRIPDWATDATVKVNGKAVDAKPKPESYLVLNRAWSDGDTVELILPMPVKVKQWSKNKDSASVDRGPLTYALDIGEKWVQYGDVNGWATYRVLPTTDWNYGLVLDGTNPGADMKVEVKPGEIPGQPFTPDAAPVRITAQAKAIPHWTKDRMDMVGVLHDSPVKADGPTQTVTLIPMGAARLRISQFPVIGTGPDAHEWPAPPVVKYDPTASHCYDGDTVAAISDGVVPGDAGSADATIPRLTFWDHKGTAEWVAYDFGKTARKVASIDVYWYDDGKAGGGCRPPASWTVQYKGTDGEWHAVENASAAGTDDDKFNHMTFTAVETTGLRLNCQLQDGMSGGILEWKVGE